MTDTYTLAFKIDWDEDIMELSVLEKGRNGEVYLVNHLEGDDVIDIYERITGREIS